MTRLIYISPHTAIPLLVACFGLFRASAPPRPKTPRAFLRRRLICPL